MELAQTKQPAGTTTLLREHALFHSRLAEAVALVRAARAWLYAAVQQTWEAMRTRAEVTVAERADVLLAGCAAKKLKRPFFSSVRVSPHLELLLLISPLRRLIVRRYQGP